ncbi:MAG: ribosomal protein S18-alanine N-acetyltransferase [Acidobacteriota bacterium]
MMRDAGPFDLDELERLDRASFEHPWSRESLEASLRAAGAVALAVDDSAIRERLVGFVLFDAVLDEAELLRIAVDPAARRRHIGQSLLDSGLERLRNRGVRICHLEVGDDNHAALALYQRAGFTIVGRRPGYYRHGADALLLSTELGANS